MENQRQFTENAVPEATAPYSGTTPSQGVNAPRAEAASFGANTSTTDYPPPPKRQDYAASDPRTAAEIAQDNPSGHHTGSNLINKAKGVAAQGHGLGENLRGNINAAVDTALNDKQGQAKDESVASKGEREVINKKFDHREEPRKLG
ncbi:hypothetical protein NLU13_5853 [Sarocladium strictum]|uniref:Uncharacterized protein n=1 Tax=Sarocladium strictum TaxID=5046 RepID=A0AA39GF55_SARSR|nr:hypothetical protein NLU13_5853 [Sarocladium strictum]